MNPETLRPYGLFYPDVNTAHTELPHLVPENWISDPEPCACDSLTFDPGNGIWECADCGTGYVRSRFSEYRKA